MGSNRSSVSFFQNPKPLINRLYDNFIWAYEHSPINFSRITGIHHPGISRLPGNIFLGRLQHASKEHGAKLGDEIAALTEVALKDKRGIAYCSYGQTPVILAANPAIVEQIALYNDGNTDREETLQPFNYIFGQKNLFGMHVGQEWREKRTRLKSWIFEEKPLENVTDKMQDIIDEYIKKLDQSTPDSKADGVKSTPSLEKFMVALAMDLFTRSVLDTPSLAGNVETISAGFSSALVSSSNPQNVILLKLSAIGEYFNLKVTGELDKERQNLQSIVTESFLRPNHEKLKQTENFLQKHFHEAKEENQIFNAAYEDAAGLLLAGHETTSRLLQFTIMHLANNPQVVKKLREEIDSHRPTDGKWTREHLKNMTYLAKVLKESLRLNPPVPIIPRVATNQFIIADIPRCKTRNEYDIAMSQRDTTKDIVVSKGSIVFISPWVTHRLASVYENPLEFRPERFKTSNIFITHQNETENDPCVWFPFGLGRRDCPGRKIAIQEAQLTLIKFVDKFDFTVSMKNKSDQLFNTYMQGTLKHKGEVAIDFKERNTSDQSLTLAGSGLGI